MGDAVELTLGELCDWPRARRDERVSCRVAVDRMIGDAERRIAEIRRECSRPASEGLARRSSGWAGVWAGVQDARFERETRGDRELIARLETVRGMVPLIDAGSVTLADACALAGARRP